MRIDIDKSNLKKAIIRFCCLSIAVCLLLALAGCGKAESQITDLSGLNGKSITVQQGTVFAAVIKQTPQLAGSSLSYASTDVDALARLLGKKTDAYVTDNVIAQTLMYKYDGLMLLDETLSEAYYGIAFPKGSAVRAEFDTVLERFEADGTLETLRETWLGDDSSVKTVPEQTWPGSKGTLRCCVSADSEPICYLAGNDYLGLDIDLVLRIARELDYQIEFVSTQFSDLIPTVAAGQADFAVSSITETAERAEMVDFSLPYMDAGVVVLVRNLSENSVGSGFFLSLKNSLKRTFVDENRWITMIKGLGTTVLLSITSALFGLVLGILLFLWSYSGSRIANVILSVVSKIFRLLPFPTFLLIVFYIIFAGNPGSNFRAATFGFGFAFALGVFGIIGGAIGGISAGQKEAAFSMGYSKYGALSKIFIPQTLPQMLAAMQNAFVGHVQGTALAGFFAVQDIQAVSDVIRAETVEPFITLIFTAVVYILLAEVSSRLIAHIRVNLTPVRTEDEIRKRVLKGKL